jgi:AraC-like DNA-binding protein
MNGGPARAGPPPHVRTGRRHRRRLAIELLADSSLTAAEIAYRLGYEDASNFGKACHRWFKRSPGALRKQRREKPRQRARRGHTSIGR